MKEYIIEPSYKKSVIEWTSWAKEINGVNHYLQRELGWRWGSFVINVPETEEEIQAFVKEYGYEDLESLLEDYSVDSIEEIALPDPEDDEVQLDDYEYEMLDCWDGCWDDFAVHVYLEGGLDEDERSELAEAMQEIYEEGYEDAIEEDGWEPMDSGYSIVGGFKITPVPEGVNAYEFHNGNS